MTNKELIEKAEELYESAKERGDEDAMRVAKGHVNHLKKQIDDMVEAHMDKVYDIVIKKINEDSAILNHIKPLEEKCLISKN